MKCRLYCAPMYMRWRRSLAGQWCQLVMFCTLTQPRAPSPVDSYASPFVSWRSATDGISRLPESPNNNQTYADGDLRWSILDIHSIRRDLNAQALRCDVDRSKRAARVCRGICAWPGEA